MKSFLEWFKAGTKVKRWIFLITIGIALVCYAFAEILTSETMAIKDIAIKIVLTFVVRIRMYSSWNSIYSKTKS